MNHFLKCNERTALRVVLAGSGSDIRQRRTEQLDNPVSASMQLGEN
jgi:hypothetical protein